MHKQLKSVCLNSDKRMHTKNAHLINPASEESVVGLFIRMTDFSPESG